MQELRGEKIDIVPYDDDPARFVCNAIAPAEVSRVIIDAEGHRMELIVPDDKLSLAIGKKGQNVRLASQLTGWRIDIHSESKIYELERRAKEQIAAAIGGEGFDNSVAETLFKLGWRSVGELSRAAVEELAGLPGIGGPDGARKVIEAAKSYIAERRSPPRRRAQGSRSAARSLSGGQQLMELDGVDEDVLTVLAHGEHPLARGPHQDADRVDRDHDRHRHGRSRAAPPARDQLALGGLVLSRRGYIAAADVRRCRCGRAAAADARARRRSSAGHARPVRRSRRRSTRRAGAALCPSARGVRDRCGARAQPAALGDPERRSEARRRDVTSRRQFAKRHPSDLRRKTPLALGMQTL